VAGLARASIEISVEGRAVAGADPGGTDPGEATATVAIELPTAAETPVRLTARVPAGRILAARRAALGATVAGGVLLFLAGAGVALWTLARVTRPLRSLAAAAEALAAGGAPVEVPAGAPAEVGVLVARFNEMGGKLAESRDRLVHTAQLSTVGQLVAGVSHELNNPLTILLTHAEYALARLDPAAPGRAEVATVLDQGRRLARLLGELRGLVRPGDAAPAPLDLNDIARETAALIRHDAAKASVACEAVVARAPVIVRASADQIRQAALNLALNALQATPAGGRMAVRAESGAPGGRLVVEDTGPGFPPDLRDRLGEPFVSTRPGRLGLGLAITRDVAARHGGRLRLDAAPGGGARATLELPA
jgi:signal transduction histidine kinase